MYHIIQDTILQKTRKIVINRVKVELLSFPEIFGICAIITPIKYLILSLTTATEISRHARELSPTKLQQSRQDLTVRKLTQINISTVTIQIDTMKKNSENIQQR